MYFSVLCPFSSDNIYSFYYVLLAFLKFSLNFRLTYENITFYSFKSNFKLPSLKIRLQYLHEKYRNK